MDTGCVFSCPKRTAILETNDPWVLSFGIQMLFVEHIRPQSGVFFVCNISHEDSDELQEDSTIERLKHIMHHMGQRERVYAGIYNGVLYYADPRIPEEYTDWESVYWQNGIAYEIQTTHRDTPGLPDIRIRIPFDKLISNT